MSFETDAREPVAAKLLLQTGLMSHPLEVTSLPERDSPGTTDPQLPEPRCCRTVVRQP